MWSKQDAGRGRLFPLIAAGLGLLATLTAAAGQDQPFIPRLVNSSTIPAIGDLNPYGVAFVPEDFPAGGKLRVGDVLVSNFNDVNNLQGKGTTIIKLTPGGNLAPPGSADVFFSSHLLGLSTALGVLRGGFVVVGNVPTQDGSFKTIGPGALQIIDRNGKRVATWTDPVLLDGPWDLTLDDDGSLAHIYVSNVLNGTVTRLDVEIAPGGVTLLKKTPIAHGYTHVPNAAALVLGPTGLALDADRDTLFVASTADNSIYRIDNASTRTSSTNRGALVFTGNHLHGPLALRLAPGGDLLTANGDAVNIDPEHPSEITEFTQDGRFTREFNIDASLGGAFGLDVVRDPGASFNFALIDDVTNNLSVYGLPQSH